MKVAAPTSTEVKLSYTATETQIALFEFLFQEVEGYLCIVTIDRSHQQKEKSVQEKFFGYPEGVDEAIEYISRYYIQRDVYFCAHLLSDAKVRKKETAAETQFLWADVDDCPLDELLLPPTVLIESSENRLQALWKLPRPIDPFDAEAINKRIAYFHKQEGMDASGWDLTQLLRVPGTVNHKYMPPHDVRLLRADSRKTYTTNQFQALYPQVEHWTQQEVDVPKHLPEQTAEELMHFYQGQLNPRVFQLFEEEPQEDWSKPLWELELSLIESGVPLDEAFVIVREAGCNKYKRDKRPEGQLWAELVRANNYVDQKHAPTTPREKPNYSVSASANFGSLLTNEERSFETSMVEDYIEWAKSTGDAAYQYHQAGAFIVLSTLLAGRVTLPLSFATMRPNMWFMILGDTTLTRKSTAMDLAVNLLTEISPSALMATDGSIEGMLTQLSTRPGRPSLFLRDEFTGLLEMMNKRDYYAGMLEALTKLYDGSYQKRVLRKETIEIVDPILNILAGGIKEKALDLLEERHITSGFVPRFIFIMAETDLTMLRPVGPPRLEGLAEKRRITDSLKQIHHYFKYEGMEADEDRVKMPANWQVELTDDAWIRYNRLESQMREEALSADHEDMTLACMDRLAKSGLKAAMLIAASKSVGLDKIVVTEQEIVHGAFYVEQWREYTLTVIEGAGSGPQERTAMKVYDYITRNGSVKRTDVMRKFRFHGRKGEEVLTTLEERGLIVKGKEGKTWTYTSIDVPG